jgi:hypothetical protein
MADVYAISKQITELFEKHELTNAQALFALKAAELSVTEDITRHIIEDSKKGHDGGNAGIH